MWNSLLEDYEDETVQGVGHSRSSRYRRKKEKDTAAANEESEFDEIFNHIRLQHVAQGEVPIQQEEDTVALECPPQSMWSPRHEADLVQSLDQGEDTQLLSRPSSHQSNLGQHFLQVGEGPAHRPVAHLSRDIVNQEDDYEGWTSDSSTCLDANFSFEEHNEDEAMREQATSENEDEDEDEDETNSDSGDNSDNDYRLVPNLNITPEESSNEDEDEDDEGRENLHFCESLDIPLDFNTHSTMKESLILDLALLVRHHFSYEALIQMFESKNTVLGKKFFPTSKKELWRLIGRQNSGIISHVYCSDCGSYVNKKKLLPEVTVCPNATCKKPITTSTAKYFVTISLRKQLQCFLNAPCTSELLSYRDTRQHSDNTIDDIFDGNEYKRLQREIMNLNDFTMTLNVDACKMTKTSKLKVTPVFLRVNEIHPQRRQQFMFMAALFVDVKEPNSNCYFKPIVQMLNDLSKNGITWNRNDSIVTSRFFTICFCVDGVARAQLLNMNPHSGKYGCTYCTINGVRVANTMRYPARPDPMYEDRNHDGMKLDMNEADTTNTNVRGHKGLTVLIDVKHLDLALGCATDDLHNLYECAVKVHMNLILKATPRLDQSMGYETMCGIIDERMKNIKTPDSVSRKPGVTSVLNRDTYKGNEWKNLLIHYIVPCLQNLVSQRYIYPLELLSNFAFTLSQDKIFEEDLIRAETYISEYLIRFEEIYGIARTRLNMHALVHAPKCVRNLGPYWVYSTFNFESWNAKILRHVTSPKGLLLQVVMRHLIQLKLEMCTLNDESISDTVRVQLKKILDKKKRRVNAVKFSENCHLLGPSYKRQVTPAELEVLGKENFSPSEVEVFRKAIVNTVQYEAANRRTSSKSDNSTVYTHQDTFCQIQDIVMFEDTNGVAISGMFVKEFDVAPRPFQHARHISKLYLSSFLPHFLQCHQVKTPVVIVSVLGQTYVVPLPNNYDID